MKLSIYCLSQLETEFEAERIQQTKAHEIMTKYAIDPSCFSDLMHPIWYRFFRELKAQHEREMDFLHITHSDQVYAAATRPGS